MAMYWARNCSGFRLIARLKVATLNTRSRLFAGWDHSIAPTSVSRTVLVLQPIDRCEPVPILFSLSDSHFEIEGLNAFRQRANLAGAESIVVEREHWGYFRATATKEGLIGDVDLGPVNLALDDG